MHLKRKPRRKGWESGIQGTRDRRIEPLVNTQQKKTGLQNWKVRGGEKAEVKVSTALSLFKASLEILFFAHAWTSYADVFHLKLNGRPRSDRPVNGIFGARLASKSLFWQNSLELIGYISCDHRFMTTENVKLKCRLYSIPWGLLSIQATFLFCSCHVHRELEVYSKSLPLSRIQYPLPWL